jgi:hypothetical protein
VGGARGLAWHGGGRFDGVPTGDLSIVRIRTGPGRRHRLVRRCGARSPGDARSGLRSSLRSGARSGLRSGIGSGIGNDLGGCLGDNFGAGSVDGGRGVRARLGHGRPGLGDDDAGRRGDRGQEKAGDQGDAPG